MLAPAYRTPIAGRERFESAQIGFGTKENPLIKDLENALKPPESVNKVPYVYLPRTSSVESKRSHLTTNNLRGIEQFLMNDLHRTISSHSVKSKITKNQRGEMTLDNTYQMSIQARVAYFNDNKNFKKGKSGSNTSIKGSEDKISMVPADILHVDSIAVRIKKDEAYD